MGANTFSSAGIQRAISNEKKKERIEREKKKKETDKWETKERKIT